MSTSSDNPEELNAINGEWIGAEAVGGIWDDSMFPRGPRDSRFYGPQDPLDFVVPPGPFDDQDGDESWRQAAQGRIVYTGDEFVKVLRPPTVAEQAYRQDFWDKYEAQRVQLVTAAAQGHRQVLDQPRPAAAAGEHHFPDALPAYSVTPTALLAQQQISAPSNALLLLPAPRTLPSHSAAAPASASASASAPVPAPAHSPALPVVTSASAHHSSDINGEHEIDDILLPDAPQGPPLLTSTEKVARGSASRTSSPFTVDEWNDANLLTLWKHKVIRKKGYEPILTSFENQTAESLHEAWKTHKERCKLLGAAWEAAGKPKSPLSEWFED